MKYVKIVKWYKCHNYQFKLLDLCEEKKPGHCNKMSKRGLSFDEKKARILELFHEKKEFFQLKELEKLAPKEKGVVAKSVKEVVQTLVDEGAVDTDKIGGSVFFWSFPSKVINAKKRKLEDLRSNYESSSKKLKTISETLAQVEDDHKEDDSQEIEEIMRKINELTQTKTELEKKISQYSKDNPVDVESMEKKLEPLKNAANRWTDNIFALKSWCKKKFMVESDVFHKQFRIPDDLDYLE